MGGMKRLLRFLGRMHLFLDTQPPQEHGRPVDARTRDAMRKDMEWQKQVREATRPQRENNSNSWFNR